VDEGYRRHRRGKSGGSTAEKGKKFFEAVTDRVSGFLVDLASADVAKMYE